MSDKIIIWIIIGVVVALTVAVLLWLQKKALAMLHRRKVYNWLQVNIRNKPGESHVTIPTISGGTMLTEELVLKVCVQDHRILRSESHPDQWSIWLQDPQSIDANRDGSILGGKNEDDTL